MMRRTRMSLQSPQVCSLAVFVMLGALLTTPTIAKNKKRGPLCSVLFVTCSKDIMRRPIRTDGHNAQIEPHRGSYAGDVKRLWEQRRTPAWILRNCSANILQPEDCDWRRTIRRGKLVAKRSEKTQVRPAPSRPRAERISRRTVPSSADAPRRGANGLYGTVPAPALVPSINEADTGPFSVAINRAAARYKLPPDLIRAVMKIESGYNPNAVSVKGAIGLMQLLPTTAAAMGVKDPRDPAENIMGGARFLRVLANRFRGDLVKVLSAYHAGSTRVKRRGATPFAKTDSYVRKVLGVYYALRDRR